MHLQGLRTRAGDTTAARLFRIENTLEVVRVAQKTTPLPVIPKPAVSARNLLTASSDAADSSRDTAALRNDNSGGAKYNNTNSSASASRPLEIVYNNKCCLRPDDDSPSKATDNHFLPLHVLQRDGRSVDPATSASNSRGGRQPGHHGPYAGAVGYPRL